MDIYILMCNDTPKHAVIGTLEQAEQRMATLQQVYYEEHKWLYGSFEVYQSQCHWHIRLVPGEQV